LQSAICHEFFGLAQHLDFHHILGSLDMAATAKQIAANRDNAQKSTGPRTLEGKARSRANAVKHGLTGEGIALPTEDADEVRRRFSGLHAEMGASGMLGDLLAHRVALSSVRLDRSARQEAKALSEKVRRAGADFDEARAAEADHLLGYIGVEPITHRRMLLRTPEGTVRLIDALFAIREELDREGTLQWDYNYTLKIEAYFGRHVSEIPYSRGQMLSKIITGDYSLVKPEDIAHLATDNAKKNWACDELVVYIDAELARLRAHHETFDHEAIALDRAEAAERAMFDPSNAAVLARRYEAAAERAFYKALHEFRAVESAAESSPVDEADDQLLEAGDSTIIPPAEQEFSEPKPLSANDLDTKLGSFGTTASGPRTGAESPETPEGADAVSTSKSAETHPARPVPIKSFGDLGRLSGVLASLIMIWLVLCGSRAGAEGADSAMAKRLYVGNLVFSTTSSDLRALFAEHGVVHSAQVQVDRESGKGRGFGFVLMPNDAEADAAIAHLDGSDYHDRRLNVNEAQAKVPPRRDDRGGPGRREGSESRSGGRS